MDDFNSEIPGPSSCSNPSEPPDIRNWFSSYKYESFVLDTCENFGGISSDENESDRYDSAIGKEESFDGSEEIRNVDEAENFNYKEDSLHSLSLLSEPSDIRKWYPSYVYESPSLDTNDGFDSYVSRETECEKDKPINEESIKDEFANLDEFQHDASDNICSTKLVKRNSSLVDMKDEPHPLFSEPLDIGNWFPDYVYESPVLDTSDEFKDALCKDKENIAGKDVVENGFITTKKKSIRTKDENSQRGSSRKLRDGEKDCSVMKRKVLAETSNIDVEAKAMEITGKWRCPQKSKPPRVPPLKQLRLERWLHRDVAKVIKGMIKKNQESLNFNVIELTKKF